MVAAPDLMHATQVPRPFHTKRWVYEEKYDGWRMLAVKEVGGVRLVSRNGRDHTKRFHAIAEALAALKPKILTLDGEVAVFDAELVSQGNLSVRAADATIGALDLVRSGGLLP